MFFFASGSLPIPFLGCVQETFMPMQEMQDGVRGSYILELSRSAQALLSVVGCCVQSPDLHLIPLDGLAWLVY